jgi:Rieske Fe-S protein
MFIAFALPENGRGDGTVVAGTPDEFPEGSVTYFEDEHFFLWRFEEPEQTVLPKQSLWLALSDSAQHLDDEVVEWRPDFEFQGRLGWFRSPFHGETFSDRGIVTFGPASRDMDRYEVRVEGGKVIVDTSTPICGPSRTLPDAPCKRVAPPPVLFRP